MSAACEATPSRMPTVPGAGHVLDEEPAGRPGSNRSRGTLGPHAVPWVEQTHARGATTNTLQASASQDEEDVGCPIQDEHMRAIL